jgi:hypothetical protein
MAGLRNISGQVDLQDSKRCISGARSSAPLPKRPFGSVLPIMSKGGANQC